MAGEDGYAALSAPKTLVFLALCSNEKISRKNFKIVLTCAISFGTICKSAIGLILPSLRDIAMNREIAQSSEVTFGEYVRTSGG